jgi:hypothetical protein
MGGPSGQSVIVPAGYRHVFRNTDEKTRHVEAILGCAGVIVFGRADRHRPGLPSLLDVGEVDLNADCSPSNLHKTRHSRSSQGLPRMPNTL